jgi:pimeloyl-ACP methyl ester carboxylesterase
MARDKKPEHKKQRSAAQPPPARPAQRMPPEIISGRWLLKAVAATALVAAACLWLTLALLFWQGGWQLLYHPQKAVTRTPASLGLRFDPVGFDVDAAGQPQLAAWWVPADGAKFTAIYLHGADGNLGDTIDTLARLHAAGINVFALDYRGYGQSRFARPGEAAWRADAEAALSYLENTRHLPAGQIVVAGEGLGANLALEVAAAHSDLAGVIANAPRTHPADTIFADPRSRLVPAHWLVDDRWNEDAAARGVKIPALWFERAGSRGDAAYEQITARKVRVWGASLDGGALKAWLDNLEAR